MHTEWTFDVIAIFAIFTRGISINDVKNS